MRVLIFGGIGQLGKSLSKELHSRGINFLAASRLDADITNYDNIKKVLLKYKPSIIINAAAYTNVDEAENQVSAANLVNAEGPKNIAMLSSLFDIPVIHISTDYVFNGLSNTPYRPDDIPDPASIYGKTKYDGEFNIKKFSNKYLILRTAWLFSCFEKNFLTTMARLPENHNVIKVVSDQVGSPTNTNHLAKVICNILQKVCSIDFLSGTYHYVDSEPCSRFEFAKEIFIMMRKLNLVTTEVNIEPIFTAEYKTQAVRPIYSVLDVQDFCEEFKQTQFSWQASLEETLLSYFQNI